MKVQQFLAHHGIAENPFGQEDASSDHVFRQHCVTGTHHPAWDKIYGSPTNPSTAVVFGEKGSGKTALRLQIAEELQRHNRTHPDVQAFVVEYDDFNPFLDSFRERLHGRKRRPERAVEQWRLWDHMDAILSLAVTQLVRGVLYGRTASSSSREFGAGLPTPPEPPTEGLPSARETSGRGVWHSRETMPQPPVEASPTQLDRLSRLQRRDLLLLGAFYDHSYDQPKLQRWNALRRKLRYPGWYAWWDLVLGFVVTIATIALVWWLHEDHFYGLFHWWVAAIIAAGWLPWLIRQGRLLFRSWQVSRQIRVFNHLPNTLRRILAYFPRQELAGQPTPNKDRSDDRYELMMKLQSVLATLGYKSMIVLVDRVDEPHLINGNPERMRDLLWPMFDNKFLKHPGVGFKLLLPAEVVYYLQREEKEFYERSRLDKQNLIQSLVWTGESLYDVTNDRLRACSKSPEKPATVGQLFEETVDRNELIGIFSRFRVPRHLFKFMYRLLVEHCNRYTEEEPRYRISRETLQSTLAVYMRDLEAFDRGMGTG